MTQTKWVYTLIEELVDKGVVEFCLCAGSRNAPFIEILSKQKHIKTFSFFEERSAGFFAIGRMKRHARAVAVVTTSGTACANLLSPVIEACYSRLPLVVVSSDRPPSHRKKGTPQAMEQGGLFSPYTLENYDLKPFSKMSLKKGFSYPLHINVPLEEPLLEGTAFETDVLKPRAPSDPFVDTPPSYFQLSKAKPQKLKKTLVILGEIPRCFQNDVEQFLLSLKTFVYAEAHSGLRESESLKPYLVSSGEQFLDHIAFDSVLRIGSVPFLKFWKNLKNTQVVNVSDKPFPGVSFLEESAISFEEFFKGPEKFLSGSCWTEPLHQKDQEIFLKKHDLLLKEPSSEQSLMCKLSEKIFSDDQVFLGNSLPIRYWDEFSTRKRRVCQVFSQRGMNGIDGLISTSLGVAASEKTTWSLLGDLTTLYDLSGPWAQQFLEKSPFRLVIFNNHGGQIFSSLYENQAFQTPHQISFQKWAEFWGWSYQAWKGKGEIASHRAHIVEVLPDPASTKKVAQEITKLFL